MHKLYIKLGTPQYENFTGACDQCAWVFYKRHKTNNRNRGYYMAVQRYRFYLQVLIIFLISERSERVTDVFDTRRLNLYLQVAM